MSYEHTQVGVALATAAACTSAANVGAAAHWPIKHIIRRFVVSVTTAFDAETVITLYRRVTPGSDTGRAAIGTITVPNAAAAGTAFCLESISDTDKVIAMDEEIIAASNGAATAGAANISVLAEPAWETPVNEGATVVTS